MKPINIAIVDDHNLFRNGLRLLLNKSCSHLIHTIYEATNGVEFLSLLEKNKIDLALMDIAMPFMNGIEATEKALIKDKNIKIIALTMYDDDDYYFRMIKAGVKGFLLKESDINEVKKAIETVIKGNSYFSVDTLCNLIKKKENVKNSENNTFDLTARELEILYFICQGLSNNEIAEKLFISKRTVDKHRSNILFKTNCKNTANLVMFAIKNDLVQI